MGSGVVGVECLISGRNFVGYDINPLTVLIAKVKISNIKSRNFLSLITFTIGLIKKW
jgi:DNA modification methylase